MRMRRRAARRYGDNTEKRWQDPKPDQKPIEATQTLALFSSSAFNAGHSRSVML